MFTSRPSFIALLQLGLVLCSCSSDARGLNSAEAQKASSKAPTCGYTINNAAVSRITGPVNNNYPMIAALAIVRDNSSYRFCQGTIIGPRHILTTMRCSNYPNETYAVVGSFRRFSKGYGGQYGYPIIEKDIRNHKKGTLIKCVDYKSISPDTYDDENRSNIPWLFLLEQAITFSSEVVPACLPVQFSEPDMCSTNVYLIGWRQNQDNLSWVTKSKFSIIPNIECAKEVSNYSNQLCLFSEHERLNVKTTAEATGVYYTSTDGRIYLVGLVDRLSPRKGSMWSGLNVLALTQWIAKETGATNEI